MFIKLILNENWDSLTRLNDFSIIGLNMRAFPGLWDWSSSEDSYLVSTLQAASYLPNCKAEILQKATHTNKLETLLTFFLRSDKTF